MTDNSTPTAPAPRSWRTPLLVALVVVVISVVVTILVRHGDDDSASPGAGGSTTSTPSTGSPSASDTATGEPSASTTSSTTPTAGPSVAPGVDLDAILKKALKDKFPALIPSEVPAGWTLTGVSWKGGVWVLDFTVPGGATAHVFQSSASEPDLVAAQLGSATSDGTVNLKKYGTGTWNAYQGSAAYGLTHAFSKTEAVVVAADKATATTLAQQLLTAEDGQLSNDD